MDEVQFYMTSTSSNSNVEHQSEISNYRAMAEYQPATTAVTNNNSVHKENNT